MQLRRVRMAEYVITTAVGTGEKGFAGDGGPANAALLNGPFDVAFDSAGNLYFSDTFNHRIRRVDGRTGIIATVAGNGEAGHAGDGGPATRASLNEPYGILLDSAGNLYFSDTFNHPIPRGDAPNGSIATVAGNGEAGHAGDGGPATRASLNEPYGIVLDRAGNIYIADRLNRRVRRVDAASGIITSMGGTGEAAYSGDGGPAAKAGLAEPNGLALDAHQPQQVGRT